MNERGGELDRLRWQINRLLDLSGCFAFLSDEEQVLTTVLREFSDTSVARCAVALFEDVDDRDPAWLRVVAVYDGEHGEMNLSLSPDQYEITDIPPIGRLLREKEPLIVQCDRDGEFSPLCRSRLLMHEMETAAIVPLVVMGWPIGILVLGKRSSEPFDQADLRLYQILANLAAMSLRAVRLIETQRRRMAEQHAVYQVGQAVSRVLLLDDLLEMVYQQINTVMHAENFYIALYDPSQDLVSFPFAVENGRWVRWRERQAGRGLTEYVLRTRQPLLLPDRVAERLEKLGVAAIGQMACSWIGAPLIVGDKVIGVMAAQDFSTEGLYTPADLELMAMLANQVAIAVENARLYEEIRRQASYLHLAAQVGRRIILILDLDELLQQVVELIRESFGYYHVQVALVDEKTQEVVACAGSSVPGLNVGKEFPRLGVGKEGLIGWVAAHGEPLMVNDVSQDPRYLHVAALPDTRSELVVPIKFAGRVIGVLDVESDRRNAFQPAEIPIMYTLADQIAVAIVNARLFAEQERHIRELNALVKIGESLCRITRFDQLGELIYAEADALFDVSNLFIALYDPQTATLQFPLFYEHGHLGEAFTLSCDSEDSICRVITSRQPMLLDGTTGPASAKMFRSARAWLGVPILRGERVLGVLGVYSDRAGAFDEHHQRVLSVIASQVALALNTLA